MKVHVVLRQKQISQPEKGGKVRYHGFFSPAHGQQLEPLHTQLAAQSADTLTPTTDADASTSSETPPTSTGARKVRCAQRACGHVMQCQATLPPLGRAPHEPFRANHLNVSHAAQHSPPTLRCPSCLPPHRKIWPPGRSCAPVCLSRATAGRLYAICHLSHVLVWEYNIPQ